MRLIKFSLIVMGLLIIGGFLFVGYVSYQRMTGSSAFGKPPARTGLEGALVELEAVTGAPAVSALGLSDDARVEEIDEVGNHALVLVRQPAAADRLYVIDARSGAVTAAIALGKVPPPVPSAVVPPARVPGADH